MIIQDHAQKQGTGVVAPGNIMSDIDRIQHLAGIDENTTTTRISAGTRSKLQQVYKVATAKNDSKLKSFQKGGGASFDNIVNFLASVYLEKNLNLPDAGTMTPPMPIDDFVSDSKE